MIGIMPVELFEEIDSILRSENPGESLRFLAERFRERGQYRLYFEARLMQKRMELGLPLIQTETASAYPADKRTEYDDACIAVARETGELFLNAGQIEAAWPYFRALNDPAPIAKAIEQYTPVDDDPQFEGIVAIAFQEAVSPVKGLQLIASRHGMCRAITSFGMFASQNGREECIGLLVQRLHAEVLENLLAAVEAREGTRPEGGDIAGLIASREYLFGEFDSYVDTSHLMSVLQYAPEVTDASTLDLLNDLCEYGKRLSEQFHFECQPPFEDPYADYGAYVRAQLGIDTDEQLEHFRRKIAESDPERVGSLPAQVLVNLLVRLGRTEEALAAALDHLRSVSAADLSCPSAMQLAYMAKKYDTLAELARERNDPLSYAAAALQPAT